MAHHRPTGTANQLSGTAISLTQPNTSLDADDFSDHGDDHEGQQEVGDPRVQRTWRGHALGRARPFRRQHPLVVGRDEDDRQGQQREQRDQRTADIC